MKNLGMTRTAMVAVRLAVKCKERAGVDAFVTYMPHINTVEVAVHTPKWTKATLPSFIAEYRNGGGVQPLNLEGAQSRRIAWDDMLEVLNALATGQWTAEQADAWVEVRTQRVKRVWVPDEQLAAWGIAR